MVVAIDGPAGAGKSTVARALADKLGFSYLDSGAMYRAAAVALEDGAEGHLGQRAAKLDIRLGERVLVGDRDVTEAIRTTEASEAASRIATVRSVRDALVERQRKMLAKGDWVAEGRDIGTVVCTAAELKVFLTASPEERARRRADQLGADWRKVLQDQTLRDEHDRTREHSPLRAAVDAIEIDSTDRTVEDVVSQIAGLVRDARK